MAAPIAARGSPHNARRDRRSDAAADTTSRRASCASSPTARAARRTRPVRGSVCNCFAASCFLHYQSDAARRFVDRSLSCAAGAAAQAPLGLNAGCKTAFMSRVLGRQGSRIGTPFGASFSHRNAAGCKARQHLPLSTLECAPAPLTTTEDDRSIAERAYAARYTSVPVRPAPPGDAWRPFRTIEAYSLAGRLPRAWRCNTLETRIVCSGIGRIVPPANTVRA